jgi:hypothetical protein
MFQCESVAVSIFLKEREAGKPYYLSGAEFVRQPDGSVRKREAVGATHELVWADDPLGQTIQSAVLRLDFEDGPPRELRLEALPTRFYLRVGSTAASGAGTMGTTGAPTTKAMTCGTWKTRKCVSARARCRTTWCA